MRESLSRTAHLQLALRALGALVVLPGLLASCLHILFQHGQAPLAGVQLPPAHPSSAEHVLVSHCRPCTTTCSLSPVGHMMLCTCCKS